MKFREYFKKFRHFNAGSMSDAAQAYVNHIDEGGKMFITLAGAMSTAEIGSWGLAEMIRQDKVHYISCTGANLEEDLFNLVANKSYKRIKNYRTLKPEEEIALREQGLNRVTDTCIPEEKAVFAVEDLITDIAVRESKQGNRILPHELFYKTLDKYYDEICKKAEIDPKDSWLVAAWKKKLPLFVPGWEDSTLGNILTVKGTLGIIDLDLIKSGMHYFSELIKYYRKESQKHKIGFFQVGGGIAGDAPICVVPAINQDLIRYGKDVEEVPYWSYFCQISDSTTSYGSYSGAVPNEKISWGKLSVETPSFIIESDATIVLPLIFSYVLDE